MLNTSASAHPMLCMVFYLHPLRRFDLVIIAMVSLPISLDSITAVIQFLPDVCFSSCLWYGMKLASQGTGVKACQGDSSAEQAEI